MATQQQVPIASQLFKRQAPAPSEPAKQSEPKKARNVVGLLLDASSSMMVGKRDAALLRWWKDQVLGIRKESYDAGQYTLLGVSQFAGDGPEPSVLRSIQGFVPVDGAYIPIERDPAYLPYGNTPLLYSIREFTKQAIEAAKKDEDKFSSTGILVIVATDGEENRSGAYVVTGFASWLKNLPENVTIGFIGPRSMRGSMERFGVEAGNCLTWDGDAAELEKRVSVGTQSAYAGYTATRAAGKVRTSALFVDVAGKEAQLLALPDLRAAFKQIAVDKESEIAPFCREHKLDYILGRAFYQLSKTERVQPHKKVALRDKKTGKIVAGEEVKKILGVTSTGELRLKPGNLGNFDLFVSSTSMNRNLVRGTKLLYAKKEIA